MKGCAWLAFEAKFLFLNAKWFASEAKSLLQQPRGQTSWEKKEKSTPAKRPRALRKGSLTSKLERVSPEGHQA
eukprot:1158160-Pelagomonas_calceolata.AAC.4